MRTDFGQKCQYLQTLPDRSRNSNATSGLNGVHQVMSSELKKALVDFQRDNELPVGQLDYQTLDALGISF